MDFVIFILAMGGLIFGADFIVSNSERIAIHLNISEFIIGSTLIALGTSLPEMATSIAGSMEGKSEIAISNAIGSNILNITFVLAIIFLINRRFIPKRNFFVKDSIWIIVPIILFLVMIMDGAIDNFDSILLILLMGAYIIFLMQDSKGLGTDNSEEILNEPFSWIKSILALILGFIFVVIGAHFAVDSASSIAKSFGVSEWVIGIVLISFGTSLPELVVSISAIIKGKIDMAIGNIIGSNFANITIAIGVAGLVGDLNIDLGKYSFDLAIVAISTLMLIFIMLSRAYNKPSGVLLLIIFALFLEHSLSGIETINQLIDVPHP